MDDKVEGLQESIPLDQKLEETVPCRAGEHLQAQCPPYSPIIPVHYSIPLSSVESYASPQTEVLVGYGSPPGSYERSREFTSQRWGVDWPPSVQVDPKLANVGE
jgi:hypothetical protein